MMVFGVVRRVAEIILFMIIQATLTLSKTPNPRLATTQATPKRWTNCNRSYVN